MTSSGATWTKMANDLQSSIQTAQLLLQKLTSMAQEAKLMALKINEEKEKTIDWEKVKQEVNALTFALPQIKAEIESQLMEKGYSIKWKLSEEVQYYKCSLSCHMPDEDGFPIKLRIAEDYVKDMIAYAEMHPNKKCFWAAFQHNNVAFGVSPNMILWFSIKSN
jgi:hypothetical protein